MTTGSAKFITFTGRINTRPVCQFIKLIPTSHKFLTYEKIFLNSNSRDNCNDFGGP